jgi:hypothetical protein
MIIDMSDSEMLLSYAEEMASLGYHYAAFCSDQVINSDTIEFFRTSMDSEEYCLVKTNDADYFRSLPIESLIRDLNALMRSGLDISCNEAFDLTGFAQRERDRKELLENNLNINIMNEKNVEYLKDQLKYSGFGDAMENALVENIQKGNPEFKLSHEAKYGTDTVLTSLNFKKSEQSDMYFFNSYDMDIQKEGRPVEFTQTFYINRDNNITAKEAYNLMEGRAVNKDLKNREGEVYNAWLKMDFKEADEKGNFKLNHYHQNYGYDLEASLAKHSIKELETPKQKEDLINSLKKGNIQSVTFVIGAEERKQYIEANPHFKTINVYDGSMQRINDRESKGEKKNQSESKSEGRDAKQKQDTDSESPESGTKQNTKKKRQGNSI